MALNNTQDTFQIFKNETFIIWSKYDYSQQSEYIDELTKYLHTFNTTYLFGYLPNDISIRLSPYGIIIYTVNNVEMYQGDLIEYMESNYSTWMLMNINKKISKINEYK